VRLTPLLIKKDERLPCIIYAHGNSSDLGSSLAFISKMVVHFKAEYIAFDYTGYGASRITHVGEEIITSDLEMVLAWANRPLDNVILWGFSLGTCPVLANAVKHRVKAIVLQCPIGSLACMFYE
jgi:pimeloyl-ACP methyl ester carboxylesterase